MLACQICKYVMIFVEKKFWRITSNFKFLEDCQDYTMVVKKEIYDSKIVQLFRL